MLETGIIKTLETTSLPINEMKDKHDARIQECNEAITSVGAQIRDLNTGRNKTIKINRVILGFAVITALICVAAVVFILCGWVVAPLLILTCSAVSFIGLINLALLSFFIKNVSNIKSSDRSIEEKKEKSPGLLLEMNAVIDRELSTILKLGSDMTGDHVFEHDVMRSGKSYTLVNEVPGELSFKFESIQGESSQKRLVSNICDHITSYCEWKSNFYNEIDDSDVVSSSLNITLEGGKVYLVALNDCCDKFEDIFNKKLEALQSCIPAVLNEESVQTKIAEIQKLIGEIKANRGADISNKYTAADISEKADSLMDAVIEVEEYILKVETEYVIGQYVQGYNGDKSAFTNFIKLTMGQMSSHIAEKAIKSAILSNPETFGLRINEGKYVINLTAFSTEDSLAISFNFSDSGEITLTLKLKDGAPPVEVSMREVDSIDSQETSIDLKDFTLEMKLIETPVLDSNGEGLTEYSVDFDNSNISVGCMLDKATVLERSMELI